jgi:hypothetical protein
MRCGAVIAPVPVHVSAPDAGEQIDEILKFRNRGG